jgi:hypothetical protein
MRSHGTGMGVAVVERRWSSRQAADRLARDVVAFDQRGCLSPRFVLVEGDAQRAEAIGHALHEALTAWSTRVPRGPLGAALQSDVTRYRAAAEALGPCFCGTEHLVAVDRSPRALLLPPAARCVLVVPCGRDVVEPLLGPWRRHVVAIGGWHREDEGSLAGQVGQLIPSARRSELGSMQTPALDGPVDLRTVEPGDRCLH